MTFLKLNNGDEILIKEDAKKELLLLLKERTRELGHQMSFEEAEKDPKMVHPNQLTAYCGGTFGEHATKAWWEVEEENQDDDDKPAIKLSEERLAEIRANPKKDPWAEIKARQQPKPRYYSNYWTRKPSRESPGKKKENSAP